MSGNKELNPEQLKEISGGVNLNVLTEEERAEYKRLDKNLREHYNDVNLLAYLTYRQKMTQKYGSAFQHNP